MSSIARTAGKIPPYHDRFLPEPGLCLLGLGRLGPSPRQWPPQWVWVAVDPESTLQLALDIGNRPLAMARRLVHRVAQVLAPDCAPLLYSRMVCGSI